MAFKVGDEVTVNSKGIAGVEARTRGYKGIITSEPQESEHEGLLFNVEMLEGPDTGCTYFAAAYEMA